MPALETYRAKRDFTRTKEPKGAARQSRAVSKGGAFVIHKHAARRLHYDLRLEYDGVLWSWAITKGPSLDPSEKRLAVHVEDHPLEYGRFEGMIPSGQYGAGAVIIWDRGKWVPQDDPAKGMAKGHLAFELKGEKLGGLWHLVRLRGRRGEKRENWLLMKAKDKAASEEGDILELAPDSVVSRRSIGDLEKGITAPKKPASSKRRKAAASPPAFIEPVLAKLQPMPPSGDDWVHEVKFDGYRLQARIDSGKVELRTRSGLDWTKRFGATIARTFLALDCENAIIDGEATVQREGGGTSFSALQNALSEGETADILFYAFDLLFLDGIDLRGEPLLSRKARLETLLTDDAWPVKFSEHFEEPGKTMLRHACRMGLEGVISKRVDAPYRSGRKGDWIKSKCTNRQEFVIAGYVPSTATGRDLASILVGYYRDGVLIPAGRVGTGFTRKSVKALKDQLDALGAKTSPYEGKAGRERGLRWVKPELVAEVEFRDTTDAGILRHASFLGLREDKPADDVVQEAEESAGKGKALPQSRRGPAARTAVSLSNPNKVLWPEPKLTKRGMLDYYAGVWDRIRPHVVERPLSLLRAPDGIDGQKFFQKHASPGMLPAISTTRDTKGEELLFIRDFDGLAALVQLGTVEIHTWGSTIDAIETPDKIIFDLDPSETISGKVLREATLTIRDRLRELGMKSWVKTSGGKGYHVVAPIIPKADWPRVKTFCRDFAKAVAADDPKLFTATMSMKARKGRIFIDYLRNGRGATAVAAYSTRARPKGTIAAPVTWEDIERGITPDAYKTSHVPEESKDESGDVRASVAL
jgi:bifunctional non-homologous end joining protein LigD